MKINEIVEYIKFSSLSKYKEHSWWCYKLAKHLLNNFWWDIYSNCDHVIWYYNWNFYDKDWYVTDYYSYIPIDDLELMRYEQMIKDEKDNLIYEIRKTEKIMNIY